MNLFTFNSNSTGIRKLLRRLFFLFLGFFVTFLVLSYLYETRLIRPLDLFIKKIEPIKNSNRDLNVIFLGDSHAGGGIKQRFLPANFYNLGFPNHNLRDQYLLLKWAHSNHPELEYVVLQTDFHIFSKKANSRDHPIRSLHFSNLRAVQRNYELSHYELLKNWLYYHFPLLNPGRRFSFPDFLFYLAQSVARGSETVSEERYRLDEHHDLNYFREYEWSNASKQEQKFTVNQQITRQFGRTPPHLFPNMIQAFKKIKKYLEKNDLRLINLRYPLTQSYFEAVPLSNEERQKFENLVKSGESVLNLNFSRLFKDREDLFRNSDHLNYRGATRLTKIFLKVFNKKINGADKL